MTMPGGRGTRIIDGGRERALLVSARAIRDDVAAAHADRLRTAGRLGRLWIRLEMAREVRRRLRHQAPPGGLYARR
jgi:hypothetical protein